MGDNWMPDSNNQKQLKGYGVKTGTAPDGTEMGATAVSVSGRTVTDVTLQSAAVATGNGTAFTATESSTLSFEVTGTSASRTVVFESAGPGGTYVSQTAYKVTDPSVSATQTTTASGAAPESWQVDVPAGWSFRARISAVAGGNVSVTGKAVVS